MKSECFWMILLAHAALAGLAGCGGSSSGPQTVSFQSTDRHGEQHLVG